MLTGHSSNIWLTYVMPVHSLLSSFFLNNFMLTGHSSNTWLTYVMPVRSLLSSFFLNNSMLTGHSSNTWLTYAMPVHSLHGILVQVLISETTVSAVLGSRACGGNNILETCTH